MNREVKISRPIILVLFLLMGVNASIAQVINGYAEVTALAGSVLTVSSVDEAGDAFEDGEQVIIMQMQDDVIGANTTNVASFGDLSAIASAGLYEIATISSHTESSGTPTSITISGALTNAYNTGANSKVQIITYPTFGSPDYTTTANMSAKDWNGTTGGVIAFTVAGVLTLAHNISADAAGFRGGSVSSNFYSGGTSCDATLYIRTSNHTRAGQKGEGIYNTTTTDHEYARGKILNGGGGGAERINAGGGGGGNYTEGGIGGRGWNSGSGCNPEAGGLGGIGLAGSINVNRVFMGGGGGGGQQNNSNGSSGGDGGGIILMKAGTVSTSCGSSASISAVGVTAANGTNDGQGGGGAGGSLVLDVDNWAVAGSCPLTIAASGGDGGDANTGGTHAGGGGGGQGVVFYSSAEPTTNITTETENGNGGSNCGSCTSAGGGSGTNGDGVVDVSSGPLPIVLLSFTAKAMENHSVLLEWKTAAEINNDYFTIERSEAAGNWEDLATINGAGNSTLVTKYSTLDKSPNPANYYRLKQTDFDGQFSYSQIVAVNFSETISGNPIVIYPNPTEGQITIEGILPRPEEVVVFNAMGQNVTRMTSTIEANEVRTVIDLSNLDSGLYYIRTRTTASKVYKQ